MSSYLYTVRELNVCQDQREWGEQRIKKPTQEKLSQMKKEWSSGNKHKNVSVLCNEVKERVNKNAQTLMHTL